MRKCMCACVLAQSRAAMSKCASSKLLVESLPGNLIFSSMGMTYLEIAYLWGIRVGYQT